MATPTVRTNLSGLGRRLVIDGLMAEEAAQQAHQEAAKNKQSFVTYVVTKGFAKPADIAAAASQEFGVSMLDLGAVENIAFG